MKAITFRSRLVMHPYNCKEGLQVNHKLVRMLTFKFPILISNCVDGMSLNNHRFKPSFGCFNCNTGFSQVAIKGPAFCWEDNEESENPRPCTSCCQTCSSTEETSMSWTRTERDGIGESIIVTTGLKRPHWLVTFRICFEDQFNQVHIGATKMCFKPVFFDHLS